MPIAGTPLWPTAVVGDAAGVWSWKVAAATNNSASKCAFATTTTQGFKLVKPGLTNTDAVVTTIPAAAQGLGWHVQAADMDMAVADRPGRRRIPAGTYIFNCIFEGSTADTTTAFGIHARIYRRFSGGAFSSVLGSGQTIGLSAVVGTADVDVPVTLSADEYFDTDETMHVEFWIRGRGGGATGLLAQTVSFHVGQAPATHAGSNDTQLAIPGGGLRYRYDRTHSTSATGTVPRPQLLVKLPDSRFAATATGTPAFSRRVTAARAFTATAVGTSTFARRVIAARAFSVTAAMTASEVLRHFRTFSVIGMGTPTLQRRVIVLKTATATGTPTLSRLLRKNFSVTMATSVTFARRLTAVRVFAVTATGTTTLLLLIPEGVLDRMEAGAPPVEITRYPTLVFVDGIPAVRTGGKQYAGV